MSTFLLLYATREGQTEKIARTVANHLTEAGHTVALRDAKTNPDTPLSCDYLICGASLHAGHIESEMLKALCAQPQLADLPRSFFLVLLSAAVEDEKERSRELADAAAKLQAQLPFPFTDVEMIAGALRYSQYSRPVRWVMQRIARAAGTETETDHDYEFTDWAQVARYAARLSKLV